MKSRLYKRVCHTELGVRSQPFGIHILMSFRSSTCFPRATRTQRRSRDIVSYAVHLCNEQPADQVGAATRKKEKKPQGDQ